MVPQNSDALLKAILEGFSNLATKGNVFCNVQS